MSQLHLPDDDVEEVGGDLSQVPCVVSCSVTGSEGVTIMNDSSVSMLAECELRLVEPNTVRTDGEDRLEVTQIPVSTALVRKKTNRIRQTL